MNSNVSREHDGGTDAMSDTDNLTLRIKAAVKAGGGNNAVAAASGIPISTLNGYIAGREPKASAVVAIAKSCDVSIEWLIAGDGEMRPAGGVALGPTMSLQHGGELPRQPMLLFPNVNMDALAAALEGAMAATLKTGDHPNIWHSRAQIACLLYDGTVSQSCGGDSETSPKD